MPYFGVEPVVGARFTQHGQTEPFSDLVDTLSSVHTADLGLIAVICLCFCNRITRMLSSRHISTNTNGKPNVVRVGGILGYWVKEALIAFHDVCRIPAVDASSGTFCSPSFSYLSRFFNRNTSGNTPVTFSPPNDV